MLALPRYLAENYKINLDSRGDKHFQKIEKSSKSNRENYLIKMTRVAAHGWASFQRLYPGHGLG